MDSAGEGQPGVPTASGRESSTFLGEGNTHGDTEERLQGTASVCSVPTPPPLHTRLKVK